MQCGDVQLSKKKANGRTIRVCTGVKSVCNRA